MGAARTPRGRGDCSRVSELATCPAGERHGAHAAVRPRRETDGLAELHDGLVERAWAPPGEDRAEVLFDLLAHPGIPHVPLLPGPSSRDAEPIRFDGDRRAAERDRGHGAGDVGADSGKAFELGDRGRDCSAQIPDDLPGCFVEVVGPSIVSGPLPDFQHTTDGGSGEIAHGRELANEPHEVPRRRRDARLLEEDLGDPDAVRVPVLAPRKRTSRAAVPAEQAGHERRGKRSIDLRARTHGTHARIEPGT